MKEPRRLRKNDGALAEELAARYLQARGLKLVTRNYHCRLGEIDLILHDGEVLVFVEVRLRSRSDFGDAAASIDGRKQAKLIHAAQHYLGTLPHIPPCRFDAVLLASSPPPGLPHEYRDADIAWVKNAFGA